MSDSTTDLFIQWCQEAYTQLRQNPYIKPHVLTAIQTKLYSDGLQVLPGELAQTLPSPPWGCYADRVHLDETIHLSFSSAPRYERYFRVRTALERVIAWANQPAEGEKSAEEPSLSLTARRPEFALLQVFANGVVDERIRQASQILTDDSLTVNEKLTKIDRVMPLPLTASAEQLGEMLGVSKQAVTKTAWWREKRRGMTDEEIDRRQARLIDRGRKYERPRAEEDDDER